MAEFFSQIGLVGAILGGFAFTFVGALLNHPSDYRAYPWVFCTSLISAMAFMVTALASVLASLAVRNSFPLNAHLLQIEVSMAFLLGIAAFVVALGTSGWIKSRLLGWLSSSIAVVTAIAVVAVLRPFVHTV